MGQVGKAYLASQGGSYETGKTNRPRVGILAIYLAGCGDDDEAAPGAVPPKTFTYTITDSGGNLDVVDGRRVAVVDIGLTGTWAAPTAAGAFQHSGDAAVTTPGSVVLTFTLSFPGAYIETIYIDLNGSGNLDNGDLVWGDFTDDFAGFCFESTASLPASVAIDWTGEMTAVGVGTSIWAGGSQPFSTDPGSLSPLGIIIPLGPGGYSQ